MADFVNSPKALAAMEQLQKWGTKYQSLSGTNKLLVGGSFGALGGLATSIFNGEEDGVMGTVKNIALGTGIDIATDKLFEDFTGVDRVGMLSGQLNAKTVQESSKKAAGQIFKGAKGIGALAGATTGIIMGDHDNVGGGIWDGIVYGAAGYGAGVLVEQTKIDKFIKNNPTTTGNTSTPIDIHTAQTTMDENKNSTTVKVAADLDTQEAKHVAGGSAPPNDPPPSNIETKKATTRAVKGLGGVRALGIAGATLFGAGVIADISNNMSEKRMVERQKRIQEENLREKEKTEDKAMRKMFGYDYMDYGNIVGELWDNRTGHHKMGNAKFQ